MMRGKSSFPAAFATAVVAMAVLLMIESVSLGPAAVEGPSSDVPPCVAKIQSCAEGIEFTDEVVDVNNAEPVCCSEWADVIENDQKCVCDAFGPLITNSTNTALFLHLCNINASADTLCQGGNSSTPPSPNAETPPTGGNMNTPPSQNAETPPTGHGAASSATWTGPISGLMLLLMTGLLLH